MKLPPALPKKSAAKAELPKAIQAFIEESRLAAHPESYLIAVLQKVQQHDGCLTPERLDAVSQALQHAELPAAERPALEARRDQTIRLSNYRGQIVVLVLLRGFV